MNPTFVSGDIILATSLFKSFIRKDNLIIFFSKNYSFIIKRVFKETKDSFLLMSDNKNSESVLCEKPLRKNNKIYCVLFSLKVTSFKKIFKLRYLFKV